jgi:hypothetical protein
MVESSLAHPAAKGLAASHTRASLPGVEGAEETGLPDETTVGPESSHG